MQLDKRHEAVETYENSTGQMSDIFVVTTPDKKNFKLRNKELLVMDLRDSDNNKIEPSARIEIAGQKPTQRNPREIDEKSYRPYNLLEMDQQYQRDNQGQLKIAVDGNIDFIEGHMIKIRLESDNVVDWDNSEIEFEVKEEPYREPQS